MPDRRDYKPVFTLGMANRTLQLTREGGGFVLLVFGVGLGAINTGNNLLYLILAMCCSFIAVSGILSEITLKKLGLKLTLPEHVYAEEATPLSLTLTNHKKRTPSYSLHIEVSPDPARRYSFENPVYVFHLPAGQSTTKTVHMTAHRRGRLRIKSCRITTSFPFGFFVKSKVVPLTGECVVFPKIHPVALPEPNESSMEGEHTIQPAGDNLYALREYHEGDPMSSVHWKSSAKTATLRVREFAGGGHQSYTLVLNLADSQSQEPLASETLEARVSETASLAYYLIRRGDEVSLKSKDIQTPYGNTENHLDSLLHTLAFIGLEDN